MTEEVSSPAPEGPEPAAAPRAPRFLAPLALGLSLLLCVYVVVKRLREPPREPTPEEIADAPFKTDERLADFGSVAEFALVDQHGKPFTRKDLDGKVSVADFIYTTCPTQCVDLTRGMRGVAARLAGSPEAQLLSFSVDPETDTPPVLARYADLNGADPRRWRFLTGERAVIYELMHDQLHLILDARDASGQIPHSTFVLVIDQRGHVRSLVHTKDEPGWEDRVARVVRILLRHPPADDGPEK